jgi:DNA-binding NarL/FixJ family response regulator
MAVSRCIKYYNSGSMDKKTASPPIEVVLADDHEIFRDGLSALLRNSSAITLTGQASNGLELIDVVQRVKPDIVLTDIKMPLLNGVEATRKLLSLMPDLGVIALSMFDEEIQIMEMLDAGARGYLLKNADKKEIFEAVECVHRGSVYYCSQTSMKLISLLSTKDTVRHKAEVKRADFSEKELQIIKLICNELSNKEIAEELNLTIRTVEKYRERIHEKTGSRNMAGVVVYAIKNGLYRIDP